MIRPMAPRSKGSILSTMLFCGACAGMWPADSQAGSQGSDATPCARPSVVRGFPRGSQNLDLAQRRNFFKLENLPRNHQPLYKATSKMDHFYGSRPNSRLRNELLNGEIFYTLRDQNFNRSLALPVQYSPASFIARPPAASCFERRGVGYTKTDPANMQLTTIRLDYTPWGLAKFITFDELLHLAQD
jgi:hypothetical protein